MEKNKIDILDETLRVWYLEKGASDQLAESHLTYIRSLQNTIEMPEQKKATLLSQLKALTASKTLGQVIGEKLEELQLQPAQLASSTSLPVRVIEDLIADKIYTNNVPIVFFKNLLAKLNVSFAQAEKSIRKTFELLQSNALGVPAASFQPSFRKGLYTEKEASPAAAPVRSDGRELYENKEALENYLTRLSELLN
jgi:hypothetical protein